MVHAAPRPRGFHVRAPACLRSAPLIAFALAIVFLGLSLGGYDPADPPGRGAEPVNQPPTNPCGPVGAALAHVLFTTLGWSSWLLLLALRSSTCCWSAGGPSPTGSARRSVSSLVLLVAAGLIHKLAPTLQPSPAVGSGGYIGALVAIFLEAPFRHLSA